MTEALKDACDKSTEALSEIKSFLRRDRAEVCQITE